jgi:hypothetical protein
VRKEEGGYSAGSKTTLYKLNRKLIEGDVGDLEKIGSNSIVKAPTIRSVNRKPKKKGRRKP